MSANDWTPVLVALIAFLLLVIPALGAFIKAWLDHQTKVLQATVKSTVEQAHTDIVETVVKAVNGTDVTAHSLKSSPSVSGSGAGP